MCLSSVYLPTISGLGIASRVEPHHHPGRDSELGGHQGHGCGVLLVVTNPLLLIKHVRQPFRVMPSPGAVVGAI